MRRARRTVAPMALAAAATAWITWPSDGEAGDTDAAPASLEALARDAVSEDPATAGAAITALRERGARNEVLFRRRIHRMFRTDRTDTASFPALNARVYRNLLLPPADDPWLGLRADDLYDGRRPHRTLTAGRPRRRTPTADPTVTEFTRYTKTLI